MMKKKHVGLVTLMSIGIGIGIAQQPVAAAPAPASAYYQITNQQPISSVVQIDQSQRSDGLFAAGPYNTSAATAKPSASAGSYAGQYATAIATATTPTGNWFQLRFNDGREMWIDARGVKTVAVNAISDQQQVHQTATLAQDQRSDGLFGTGPYRTSATTMKPDLAAKGMNGQVVTVLAYAQAGGVRWAQIQTTDHKTYWLDARGLAVIAMNPVTGKQVVDKPGTIDQAKRSDGLFSEGPYKSSAASLKPIASARDYSGQAVTVIAEAQSGGHGWYEIRLRDGQTYWLDSRGVQLITLNAVTAKQAVNKTALFSQNNRNDGLFVGGPYKSAMTSLKPAAYAGAKNGQAVTVIATAQSGGHGWCEIQLGSGQTYWIDAQGLTMVTLNPVTDKQTLAKTGVISQAKRNDGLFLDGPYKTAATNLKPADFAGAYNGQGVAVIASAQSGGHAWYEVRLTSGQTYWLDSRGVQLVTLYPVTSQSQVANTRAIVSQAKRNDGLFIGGPYRSTLQVLKPDASAKALNGQVVEVIAQAKTAIATWQQIRTGTGQTYWIDAAGLTKTDYYMISNLQAASGYVQVSQANRSDGLFANGPYKTSGNTLKPSANARSYDGKNATLLAKAQTETGSWVKIQLLDSGRVYWLDARGVKNIASPMTRVLNVPNYNQYKEGAPVGCEGTSLYQAMRAKGYLQNYSLRGFLNTIPKASSPYNGFVGSPFVEDSHTYTAIFAAPLAKWGAKYGKVTNISGASVQTIEKEVLNGNPVVAYVTVHLTGLRWGNWPFGRVPNNNHAVTVAGVDLTKRQLYLSDPIDGKYWVSVDKFSSVYNPRKMAVVVR